MSWRWSQVLTGAETKQLSHTATECISVGVKFSMTSLVFVEKGPCGVAVRCRCCGRAGQQAPSRAPSEATLRAPLLPGAVVAMSNI